MAEDAQSGMFDKTIEDDDLEAALQDWDKDAKARKKSRAIAAAKTEKIVASGVLDEPVGTRIRCGAYAFVIGESDEKDIEFTRGGNKRVQQLKLITE